MQVLIDKYFAECYKQKHDRIKHTKKNEDESTDTYYTWEPVFYPDGQPVMEYVQPVTITGLARRLNMSREDLINYEKRDAFFDTVKEAKERVQDYVEWALMAGKAHPSAAIFNLKNNYNWKDKTESEVLNTHMHLHGIAKASYQEADKLEQPTYRELPKQTKRDDESITSDI